MRGLEPIVAGRSTARIAPAADELGVEHRVFGLYDPAQTGSHPRDVDIVPHCAGPFPVTSAPIEACLATDAHYLDLTGEVKVFAHERAQQAGVVLGPW